MIKAVLFDLDNTLIDFMTMKRLSSQAAIRSMIDAGLQVEEQKGMKKLFQMYNEHGFEDQKIFNKFISEVNGKLDYKILASAISAYRKVKYGQMTPYPYTRRVLLKLKAKGLKLGIVSDAPKLQAWLRLSESNLLEFFDFVVAVGLTGMEKPHKMPFNKASSMLKLKPDEILFVGDNPKRDIIGAKKVGMKTALAKYGQVIKDDSIKADFELKSLRDILKIVES